MHTGRTNPSIFRLSQALANPPSQKGAIRSFIFRGLSPPVSPKRKMVSGYTLCTTGVT
jgi:hypothetical protein